MEGTDLHAAESSGTPGVAETMARYSRRGTPAQSVLARRLDFEKRHPEVTILLPRHVASGLWEAHWPGQGKDEPAGHDTCEGLLDYLEARFDLGDLSGAYDEPDTDAGCP